jgi:hypothetical protein
MHNGHGPKTKTKSKKYTSSASAGGYQSQVKGGQEYVTKELGLVTTVPSPISYMQGEKKTKAYNLKGKDRDFYGKEASQATNEYLVNIGAAKQGNPYFDDKGNITGYSYFLTSKGKKMKYGMTDGAMGSGDPTGIMSSVPISAKMHERQKTIQAIALGAMSLAFPTVGMGSIGGFITRSAAADALKNRGQKGYNEYMKKFEKKQETVMGSKRATLTGGKTFMTEEY